MFRRALRRLSVPAAEPVSDFQLSTVEESVGPGDYVFGQQLSLGGFKFFAWPGYDATECWDAIRQWPPKARSVHTIFGRPGVPVDYAVDIDGVVPRDMTLERYQALVLDQVLLATHKSFGALGATVAQQAVLSSKSAKGLSLHLHCRCADGVAFADHKDLGTFARHVAGELGEKEEPDLRLALRRSLDLQIYRGNGSLRIFNATKQNSQPLELLPPVALPSAQAVHIGDLAPRDVAELSFVTRDPCTIRRTLNVKSLSGPMPVTPSAALSTSDRGSHSVMDVVASVVQRIPAAAADPWRSWVKVGLCLFDISRALRDTAADTDVDAHCLALFLEFSAQSGKFSELECRSKWRSFRVPMEPNWERSLRTLERMTSEVW